jgi:hypothetical protein
MDIWQLFDVVRGSPEYNRISKLFLKTLSRSIDSIQRIENMPQVLYGAQYLSFFSVLVHILHCFQLITWCCTSPVLLCTAVSFDLTTRLSACGVQYKVHSVFKENVRNKLGHLFVKDSMVHILNTFSFLSCNVATSLLPTLISIF